MHLIVWGTLLWVARHKLQYMKKKKESFNYDTKNVRIILLKGWFLKGQQDFLQLKVIGIKIFVRNHWSSLLNQAVKGLITVVHKKQVANGIKIVKSGQI
jgi:hypothetical protein